MTTMTMTMIIIDDGHNNNNNNNNNIIINTSIRYIYYYTRVIVAVQFNLYIIYLFILLSLNIIQSIFHSSGFRVIYLI